MAHNCCTLGFCLNWVVCGPAHNRDHWQLILLSPREQNSHCCGSLLETAGLPFLLGWQGGQLWSPSHTNHQWSLFWLITSATSRHFFNCFFFFFFLYVEVDSSQQNGWAAGPLFILERFEHSPTLEKWLPEIFVLLQFWMGKSSVFFFLIWSCIHNSL